MLALALDTATAAVTAAVVEVAGDVSGAAVRVRAERDVVAANRHGELLAPLLDEVLAEAGVRPRDLEAVVAGLGPGPFTGLRVGIVTAAALGDALGVPTYGACSLDAIAVAAPVAEVGADVDGLLVCTDARRRQVYWARYDAGRTRIDGPDLATAHDLATRFAPTAAVGAGAVLYRDALVGVDVRSEPAYPRARHLAAVAAPRVLAAAPGERLDPLYLRRPDAQPAARRKQVTPT